MGAGVGNPRDERPLTSGCELLVCVVLAAVRVRRTGRPGWWSRISTISGEQLVGRDGQRVLLHQRAVRCREADHPGGDVAVERRGDRRGTLLACERHDLVRAGRPPERELMGQVLLALALRDEAVGGAEAAEVADRALELVSGQHLDPPAALEAAKKQTT